MQNIISDLKFRKCNTSHLIHSQTESQIFKISHIFFYISMIVKCFAIFCNVTKKHYLNFISYFWMRLSHSCSKYLKTHLFSSLVCLTWFSSCFSFIIFMICDIALRIISDNTLILLSLIFWKTACAYKHSLGN